LITNPLEIKQLAPLQYLNLQKSKLHGFDNILDEWAEIYESMSNVDEHIYKRLMDLSDMEEWIATLKQCNNKSAPDSSNIGYKLLKKAEKKAHEIFIKLANIIFNTAIFPEESVTNFCA
jgi:hypothetical protein